MSLVSFACMCNNIKKLCISKQRVIPNNRIEYFISEHTKDDKIIELNKTDKLSANVIKIKTNLLPRIFVDSSDDPSSSPKSESPSSSSSSSQRFATCNHDSLIYYNKRLVSLVRIYDKIDYQDKHWRRWYQTELETHERTKTYYKYPVEDDLLFARFHLYPEEVNVTPTKIETPIKKQNENKSIVKYDDGGDDDGWDICETESDASDIVQNTFQNTFQNTVSIQLKQFKWRLFPINHLYIQEPYQSQWKQIEQEINRDRLLCQILEKHCIDYDGSSSTQQPRFH